MAITLNKPTKTGYTFKNWNTKADGSGTSYSSEGIITVTADKDLYAQWTANTFTVVYNGNGNTNTSVAMADSTFTYGKSGQTLRANTYTKDGYTFVGWHIYRNDDNTFRYQSADGSETGWYEEGSQPSGWTYYVYADKQTVSKLTPTANGTVHMYALWSKDGAGWTMEDVIQDSYMFYKASSLVGGDGTTWDGGYIDSQRAKVDEGTEDPGYFTQDPY